MADAKYDYGLGRRKSATARARLTKGKGAITINGKTAVISGSGNVATHAAEQIFKKGKAVTH